MYRDAAPSDLQFLTEDNVEEIGTATHHACRLCCLTRDFLLGSAMTHVERMRLQAAMQALGDETQAAGTE